MRSMRFLLFVPLAVLCLTACAKNAATISTSCGQNPVKDYTIKTTASQWTTVEQQDTVKVQLAQSAAQMNEQKCQQKQPAGSCKKGCANPDHTTIYSYSSGAIPVYRIVGQNANGIKVQATVTGICQTQPNCRPK